MNLYKVRMYLKHNKLIYGIYCKLNRKRWEKKRVETRAALAEHGFSMVEEIEQILKDQGTLYFLSFGNLLGLEREGHFLRHDNDVDYSIFINDKFTWDMLEACMRQSGYEKIRQYSLCGEIREQTYRKGTLSVDFFSCKNEEDGTTALNFFRKDGYYYASKEEMHVIEIKFVKVNTVKKATYGDLTVTVPSDPVAYLESVYTKDWRIPNPNWSSEMYPNSRVLKEMGSKDLYLG